MLNDISIRARIVALSLASLLVIIAILSGLNLYQSSESNQISSQSSQEIISTNIEKNILTIASGHATSIDKMFSEKITAVNDLASQAVAMYNLSNIKNLDAAAIRHEQNELLNSHLSRDPSLLGVWLIMKPNKLGSDAQFIGDSRSGSNEAGRFSSYWYRSEGQALNMLIGEKSISDDSINSSGYAKNYYLSCPETKRSTCVLQPFVGSEEGIEFLMTTISHPVIVDGEVIGIAGVDISLTTLQERANEAKEKLYNGAGDLAIIASEGIIAGYSGDSTAIGRKPDAAIGDAGIAVLKQMSAGHSGLIHQGESLLALFPIALLPNEKPWWVFIDLPLDITKADTNRIVKVQSDLQRKGLVNTLIFALLAAFLGALAMWFTASSVTRQINGLADMLKDIASGEGDLTQRLKYSRRDELGNLASWFNRFLDKLQPTIRRISESIIETRSLANQSLDIAKQTSDGMQVQFRDIDQVATASTEMSATAHDVAENAAKAAQAAQNADLASKDGLVSMDRSTHEIRTLTELVTGAMQEVQLLSASSDQIGNVLDVIRSIAQQTNLLALNAAIEAARAGESGRGFAVVADEVRNLAMRTQDSIEKIREVIERLQSGTRAVVGTMQDSQQGAQSSSLMLQETSRAFSDISSAVSLISEMNLQIATAAEEQSAVAEDVSRNISSIRIVTEALNERSDEATQMSIKLNALADNQLRLAEQFKT